MSVRGVSDNRGPLISVVVPTWNSAAVLAQALQSLAAQSFRGFEVILSDGASTDETLAIAQRYASLLPTLSIDSRPDSGVYDAINRGVRLARGAWFLVLGSDDCIHAPETFAAVAEQLQLETCAHLVYGDVRMMAVNRYGVPVEGRYIGRLPMSRFLQTNICQQAIFYRRELFDTLGGFEGRYRLCADWAFNLRAEFLAPSRWVDIVVADYGAAGLSATGIDEAFGADLPELLRAGLAGAAGRRDLWPMQRRLMREADRLRRRGDWRGFWRYAGTYLSLLIRRLPALFGRS
ncbi:MAG: glycosyltransferase family 2 protein [Rhizobacter sp.]